MAKTRLGLIGPMAAYRGFTAKSAAAVVTGGSHWVGYEPRHLYAAGAPRLVKKRRIPPIEELPVPVPPPPMAVPVVDLEAVLETALRQVAPLVPPVTVRVRAPKHPVVAVTVPSPAPAVVAKAVVKAVEQAIPTLDDDDDAILWILSVAA